jgi:GNAT superfamily N-acetyltransferase
MPAPYFLTEEVHMLTFRLCNPKDFDRWVELNREFMAFEIADEDLWGGTDTADDEQFREDFHRALANPEMITLLFIEKDGEPIGFANLQTIISIWAHGKSMIIDDLYIEEKYHGQGFGRESLRYIEAFAGNKGFRRIEFKSEKTNPGARAFYEKCGYTPSELYYYNKYLSKEN